MSDTEVGVRITGNATGAVSAFNVSEQAAARALASMVEHFTKLGMISTEEMAKTGAAAKAGASEVEHAATRMGTATERMRFHFHGVTENIEIMRTKFEFAAKSIEFFNAALIGVGAILAGGFLFKEAVGETVKLTTETNKLASVYGITLMAASGLHETLHTLGIESDTATTMAMKLSRQVKAHEEALNADGIATRNAAGAQLNLLDIQTNVIDRLREMQPGLQRNKVAIDAFGRGAGDLTVLLRLNDEAMREGMATAKALGIVVTKDGVESIVAYQHSVNEAKAVIDALWVTVGQALIPVIKELSDMLKNNGTTAVHAMRSAIEGLINIVREIVAVFATFDLAISIIAGAIAALFSAVNGLGRILADVFTLNWSKIGSDFKVGIGNLVKIAHDAAAQISGDWAAMNMGWIGDAKGGKAGASGGNEANPNTGDQAPDKAKKVKKERKKKAAKVDEPTDEYMDWIKIRDEARAKSAKVAVELANIEAKGERDANLDKINADEETAKEALATRKITKRQMLALEIEFEAQRQAIRLKAIADEAAAAANSPDSVVKLAELEQQRLAVIRAYEKAVTKIKREEENARAAMARKAEDATINMFSQNIAKMLTLQQGFMTTVKGLYQGLQSIIGDVLSQVIARFVTDWLTAHGVMTAIDKLFGINSVANSAAAAGAAAVASTAAIPIVGPELAPAAGVAAAATAMSFGSLLAAEKGFDVPSGINPITQLHQREMVLPAQHADVIRGLSNGSKSGGGGETHVHIHATDAESVKRLFMNNKSTMAAAIKAALRDGVR